MNRVTIKFDGACNNNSKFKWMGVGVAVWIDGKRDTAYDYKEMHGTMGTSNIAEWQGLIASLEIAYNLIKENPLVRVRIYGDSQLIVRQFSGRYAVKKEHFKEYQTRANMYRKLIGKNLIGVFWLRRNDNTDADILSKDAITEYLKENIADA